MNKKLYGNMVNLNGLYSTKPIKLEWNHELGVWYDDTGDFEVKRIGLHASDNYIIFSSYSKKEVQIWISGIQSAMAVVHNWSITGKKLKVRN